jgi:hypothetical protein
MRTWAVCLCAVFMLAGCSSSTVGDTSVGTDGQPMGSGKRCDARLANKVTFDYLAGQGLKVAGGTVADKQTAAIVIGLAIHAVCAKGPASMTVDDGAAQVAKLIRKRVSGG